MMRLDVTESVATVGAISAGSPSQRTIARLTPRSLKLSTASRETSATANVPNACGPSRRASMTPSGRVPSLATMLLAKLQPRARDARPASELSSAGGRRRLCPPRAGFSAGASACSGRTAPAGPQTPPPVLAAHESRAADPRALAGLRRSHDPYQQPHAGGRSSAVPHADRDAHTSVLGTTRRRLEKRQDTQPAHPVRERRPPLTDP